nr:hypothetical protein [Candidatus Sigynarchaeota archaeon]
MKNIYTRWAAKVAISAFESTCPDDRMVYDDDYSHAISTGKNIIRNRIKKERTADPTMSIEAISTDPIASTETTSSRCAVCHSDIHKRRHVQLCDDAAERFADLIQDSGSRIICVDCAIALRIPLSPYIDPVVNKKIFPANNILLESREREARRRDEKHKRNKIFLGYLYRRAQEKQATETKTLYQYVVAGHHDRKYQARVEHWSKHKRFIVGVASILICGMFGVQIIQQLDSFFTPDPAAFSISGISASTAPEHHVGDEFTVSFTSTSNHGSGWIIAYNSLGHEIFRQPSTIRIGQNELNITLARDYGFCQGDFHIQVFVTWLFWGFILRTTLVYSESITICKEPTTTFLNCSIFIDSAINPLLHVVYKGSLLDDDHQPVRDRPVVLSWYDVTTSAFQPVTTVSTGIDGMFCYEENRTKISPYPYLACAEFMGDQDSINSSDDDSVTQSEVYASWQHAGPGIDHEFKYSGIPTVPKNNIITNQTNFVAAWKWGTTAGTGELDGWSLSVMEGRAFSGVSNYSAYVGTFSWFADVSFIYTSPWLVFSGTDARDANVTVVFRSLWKQLWKPDTQVTEKGSIYTV